MDNTFDAKALAGYVDVSDLLDVWIDDHKGLRKVGMLARTGLRRSCDEHALMRGGCTGQRRALVPSMPRPGILRKKILI